MSIDTVSTFSALAVPEELAHLLLDQDVLTCSACLDPVSELSLDGS